MKKIEFSLSVIVIKEGKSYVAFSPALDLSTAGKTYDEARERFGEAVELFFEEISRKNTIDRALSELGWQKHNREYTPPMIVGSQTENFSVPYIVA